MTRRAAATAVPFIVLIGLLAVFGWAHPGYRALALMKIGQHFFIACAATIASAFLVIGGTPGRAQRGFWWIGVTLLTAAALLLWLYLTRNPEVSFDMIGLLLRIIVMVGIPLLGVYVVAQSGLPFATNGLYLSCVSFVVALGLAPVASITSLILVGIVTGEAL